ncbi:MAG: topoisomerase C-terminal repeat-containing protein, partial [Clostridia bacterium]|nr:topoisomerase C-terminal repeat-containing protein [Clostridia bacterium]
EKEISEILSKKDTTTVTRVPFQPKSGSKGKSSRTKPSGPAIRIGKCPLCGNDIVRGSFAYGCLGYKNGCNFRVGTHICEREITPEEVYLLITNGKTPLLQGFISKKKTPFAAYLVLDGERVNLGFEHANKTAIFSDSCDAPLPADPPPPRGSEL